MRCDGRESGRRKKNFKIFVSRYFCLLVRGSANPHFWLKMWNAARAKIQKNWEMGGNRYLSFRNEGLGLQIGHSVECQFGGAEF